MKTAWVQLRKFKKYFKIKPGTKSTQWYRMQNDWLEHPDFFDLENDQRLLWPHLLGKVSEKLSPVVYFSVALAATITKTTSERVVETLKYFHEKRLIALLDDPTKPVPDVDEGEDAAHDEDDERAEVAPRRAEVAPKSRRGAPVGKKCAPTERNVTERNVTKRTTSTPRRSRAGGGGGWKEGLSPEDAERVERVAREHGEVDGYGQRVPLVPEDAEALSALWSGNYAAADADLARSESPLIGDPIAAKAKKIADRLKRAGSSPARALPKPRSFVGSLDVPQEEDHAPPS